MIYVSKIYLGHRDGTLVRALAQVSSLGTNVICGMGWVDFVAVSFLAERGFSQGTLVFPSPQNPTFLHPTRSKKVTLNGWRHLKG